MDGHLLQLLLATFREIPLDDKLLNDGSCVSTTPKIAANLNIAIQKTTGNGNNLNFKEPPQRSLKGFDALVKAVSQTYRYGDVSQTLTGHQP